MDKTNSLNISKIDKATITLNDVLIIKIPWEKYNFDVAESIFKTIQNCFPNNECIVVPADCQICIANKPGMDFIPATQAELFDYLGIKKQEERELNGQPEVQN